VTRSGVTRSGVTRSKGPRPGGACSGGSRSGRSCSGRRGEPVRRLRGRRRTERRGRAEAEGRTEGGGRVGRCTAGCRGRGLSRRDGEHAVHLLRAGPRERVLDEQGGQYAGQRAGLTGRRDVLAEHRGERGERAVPAQGMVGLDGHVEHHRQRPQVGGGTALLAADPLRRHVVGRADYGTGGGEAGGLADGGDPEVGEHGASVGAQQDVRRLHVTVLDADRVGGAQRVEHLPAHTGRLGRFQAAPVEAVLERAAGEELHHDPRVGALAAVDDVVDGDDVRMVDAGEGPGLPQDAFTQGAGALRVVLGEAGVRRADLLHCDLAVQRQVAGAPDPSHSPAAKPPDEFEAAVDHPSTGLRSAHAGSLDGGDDNKDGESRFVRNRRSTAKGRGRRLNTVARPGSPLPLPRRNRPPCRFRRFWRCRRAVVDGRDPGACVRTGR
jgi:hypothetical protein